MKKECYTCKYDKDCHWDDCLFGDTPTRWEPAEHYKPDTNADRIRAMSDEELAENLYQFCALEERIGYCKNLSECEKLLETEDGIPEKKCIGCLLDWLKQPAEEEKTVTEGHR